MSDRRGVFKINFSTIWILRGNKNCYKSKLTMLVNIIIVGITAAYCSNAVWQANLYRWNPVKRITSREVRKLCWRCSCGVLARLVYVTRDGEHTLAKRKVVGSNPTHPTNSLLWVVSIPKYVSKRKIFGSSTKFTNARRDWMLAFQILIFGICHSPIPLVIEVQLQNFCRLM